MVVVYVAEEAVSVMEAMMRHCYSIIIIGNLLATVMYVCVCVCEQAAFKYDEKNEQNH